LPKIAQKSKNKYQSLPDSGLKSESDEYSRSDSFIEKFEHRDERNITNLILVFMELVQDQVMKRGVATMDLVMKVIYTVTDCTLTLSTFSSKYDVVTCKFDNCENSCR
jgi:hypothetical protein